MPSRLLREGIIDSEAVNQLAAPEEVFYRRLMSVVDDFGRCDGRPQVLRSRLYPLRVDQVREADITRWMAACQKAGLIALYSVDGRQYILFGKLGTPRATISKYPDPPPGLDRNQLVVGNASVQVKTDVNGCKRVNSSVPGSYSGTGSYSGAFEDSSEPAPPASEPTTLIPAEDPLFLFPTVGKNASDWPLKPSQVAEWREAFPGVDVLAECRKSLAWCKANPARRKTFDGMPRFLVAWLTKAQNESSRHGPKTAFPTKGEAQQTYAAKMLADCFPQPGETP